MFQKTDFSTEQKLIKECLKKNRSAQKALYEHYAGSFLSICIRYLKNQEHAEDVLIESFVKIFEKLPQYEAKGSFEGWMKRIVVTQALMALRSNRHLMMEVHVDTGQVHDQVYYEDTSLEAEELMIMIQELPIGYRTVFNLYAIEGYSHQEIASLLGISESTSKSQLNRARNSLKEKIAAQDLKERRING